MIIIKHSVIFFNFFSIGSSTSTDHIGSESQLLEAAIRTNDVSKIKQLLMIHRDKFKVCIIMINKHKIGTNKYVIMHNMQYNDYYNFRTHFMINKKLFKEEVCNLKVKFCRR